MSSMLVGTATRPDLPGPTLAHHRSLDRDAISPVEWIFACVTLLLSAGAGAQWLGTGDASSGNQVLQAIWFAIYAVAALLLLPRARQPPHLLGGSLLIWGILALALISISWSAAPDVSARRMVALLGSTAVGVYLATRFTDRDLFRLLLFAAAVGTILSLLVVVFVPSQGISTSAFESGWQGVFAQKNWLGRFAGFSTILWLLYVTGRSARRGVGLLFLLLSAGLLLGSGSQTALVVTLALLLITLVLPLFRLHLSLAVPIFVIALAAGAAAAVQVMGNAESIVGFVGRDLTLTGRTQIWDVLWRLADERPWLGYGYGGFWLELAGPSRLVWLRLGWAVPSAHNGFLDLLLDLGLIGLALFALSLCVNIWRATALVHTGVGPGAKLPLVFLSFLLLSNVTESFLLVHNSLFWILYVAISFMLGSRSGTDARHMPAIPSVAPAPPPVVRAGWRP